MPISTSMKWVNDFHITIECNQVGQRTILRAFDMADGPPKEAASFGAAVKWVLEFSCGGVKRPFFLIG